MKRIIRLTESDLARIVKRVINEQTIDVGGLEIHDTLETKMTWDEATEACMSLGDGWRLPTKEEVKNVIIPNRLKIKSFAKQDDNYWTSTQNSNDMISFFFETFDYNDERTKDGRKYEQWKIDQVEKELKSQVLSSSSKENKLWVLPVKGLA
jgi:hypothetical protein